MVPHCIALILLMQSFNHVTTSGGYKRPVARAALPLSAASCHCMNIGSGSCCEAFPSSQECLEVAWLCGLDSPSEDSWIVLQVPLKNVQEGIAVWVRFPQRRYGCLVSEWKTPGVERTSLQDGDAFSWLLSFTRPSLLLNAWVCLIPFFRHF